MDRLAVQMEMQSASSGLLEYILARAMKQPEVRVVEQICLPHVMTSANIVITPELKVVIVRFLFRWLAVH